MKRLIPLIVLLAACKPAGPAQPVGGAAGGGKRPFPVEVAKVGTEDVRYTIDAVGTLEPEEQVRVTARVMGMVEKVMFEEGTKVTPKTVLAEIDRSRYQMLADRAKASLEKCSADVRKAEIVLQNRQELKKKDPGYVSDEEIATLTSQVHSARGAAAEAKSSHDLALHDFENSQVRSLITGIIDTKAVSTGQYVAPGAQLASIVDESKLKIRFKVSETESVKLASVLAGDRRVSFSVRPLPGKTFTAELIHMSPQANVQTRTVECLALVENRDAMLKPGFFATVRAVVAMHEKAVVVADSAILPTERGFVAFIVKGTKAVQRAVRPGLFVREGVVEILDGLSPGETLVVTGAAAITDGTEVVVREAPALPPPGRTVKE
jgi:multidrug efflux system membrane fusion protein